MNERIRELAIEAGDDWEHTLKEDREFLEKFAKLIVRGCVAEFEKYSTVDYASLKVKEYFGVE